MNKEMIIVLDFGGQYNQLIARRVRECNVYAVLQAVHPVASWLISRTPRSLTAGVQIFATAVKYL